VLSRVGLSFDNQIIRGSFSSKRLTAIVLITVAIRYPCPSTGHEVFIMRNVMRLKRTKLRAVFRQS